MIKIQQVARRRVNERLVNFNKIKENIEERDYQDMTRKESPLLKAQDAIELDNSNMTFAEQMVWFMEKAVDSI